MTKYNGHANYQTWNVTLWLANDETLYNLVKRSRSYPNAVKLLKLAGYDKTPDGVSYEDKALDKRELNMFLGELS